MGGATGGAIKATREISGIPYFLLGVAANNFLGHIRKGDQFAADPRVPLSTNYNSGGAIHGKHNTT
jgi:hypothetical protein